MILPATKLQIFLATEKIYGYISDEPENIYIYLPLTHLHVPVVVRNFGVSASEGTGTMISTLFAVERRLN